MKRWGIFRFELAYQIRRPWPYLFGLVLLVVSFLLARDTGVADAMYEQFVSNSPFEIAKATVFGSLFWLLVAATVAGEAAARDVATRMYPLVYAAPITKREYLVGRFAAALTINAVLLVAVQAGIVLGAYSPGVRAETLREFRSAAHLAAYVYIALPTAFVGTAIQFVVALRTGRAMTSYAGSLLLVFAGFFLATVIRFTVTRDLASLLDPIGIYFIVEDLAYQWTPIERNVRLIGLEGAILANRLLWIGIGSAVLGVAYTRFRFGHRTEAGRWWPGRWRASAMAPEPTRIGVTVATPVSVPAARLAFGFGIQYRKLVGIAWISFRSIALSWAGLAFLGAIPLLTIPVVIDQMSSLGTPLTPTTARVIAELTAPLSAELSRWVIVPLAIVFFAGELIWRERDAGIAEIDDTMPGSDWVPLLGKLAGLGLVLCAFTALQIAAGVIAQIVLGHRDFEIGLYLETMFGLQLVEYLLFALLAIAIHVVVNQKYVGHLVAIIAYAFIAVLGTTLGIEHNMLVYGGGPTWSYTAMRGFGASIAPWAWFKAYWVAWALLLAVVARLLWARGRDSGSGIRITLARRRLIGATAWTTGVAAALIVMLSGFVFYNTNVLNRYRGREANAERSAEYERRYRRYENAPQPRMKAASLRVEIYPERRAADIRGSYRLVNESETEIDSIHVATASGGITRSVTFDRPSRLVTDDDEHGFRIYTLERPLRAGDSLRLDFVVHVESRGFTNRGVDPSIAPRGSYFMSQSWFPFVGYQRYRELLSPSERREHGLPPRAILAALAESEDGDATSRGGGIAFEAVVGTASGQTAVAPGALRRSWSEGGRRYFDYATDAPIGSEWAFFSADYAVRETRWNDVVIRTFHSPQDTAGVDRMLQSVQASLAYYAAQFGAYPYHHLTLVENPAAPGTGAHADGSVISYGQGFAAWRSDDSTHLDLPYALFAHETAHQWTLPYAIVEGLPFLSEGLAWYSAIQVVGASRGDAELRRLLAFMRQPYPFRPIRRGEPLLRALDPYLAYRRGPFAMYALSEYAGADRVNGAIRRLIAAHETPGAPLATTLDLYRELRTATPDSLQYLLHDLFEVNTFWDLEATKAVVRAMPNGTWQVTLDVRARKTVVDSAGIEIVRPLGDLVEIGVFAGPGPGTYARPRRHLQMVWIRSGEDTITLTVPWKPLRAGIDPDGLLEWTESAVDDNVIDVKTVADASSRPSANSGGPSR